MNKPSISTSDEYDFLDELDDNAALPDDRNPGPTAQVVQRLAVSALQSNDLEEVRFAKEIVKNTIETIGQQLLDYHKGVRDAPWIQSEEWYRRARSAKKYHHYLFQMLNNRQQMLNQKRDERDRERRRATQETPEQKHRRTMDLQKAILEHEIIKGRYRLAAAYLEIRKCKQHDRIFIRALHDKNLLSKEQIQALWDEVDQGYQSGELRVAQEVYDRFSDTLKASSAKLTELQKPIREETKTGERRG